MFTSKKVIEKNTFAHQHWSLIFYREDFIMVPSEMSYWWNKIGYVFTNMFLPQYEQN